MKVGRAIKAKGMEFQRRVQRELEVATGIHLYKSSASCGGVDIYDPNGVFPFAVECKKMERPNIPEAFRQAERNAEELTKTNSKYTHKIGQKPYKPMVIYSRSREKPKVVLNLEDLLGLMKLEI